MKHEGRATYRLQQNPLEQKYHDVWIAKNKESDILSFLLGDGARKGNYSERDALVAATVIQWLGSPVGQKFVSEVLGYNA